jgi:hypothetical protein
MEEVINIKYPSLVTIDDPKRVQAVLVSYSQHGFVMCAVITRDGYPTSHLGPVSGNRVLGVDSAVFALSYGIDLLILTSSDWPVLYHWHTRGLWHSSQTGGLLRSIQYAISPPLNLAFLF